MYSPDVERVDFALSLAKGKKVLDVGCTGGDDTCLLQPEKTMHARIAEVSKRCVGIDIREDGLRSMKASGYDVFFADAERFDLPEKDFDFVCLSDVIEHLSNPGICLKCCNNHLKPGGKILIT
jgi:2-polyprenyl-3-methyl-5-hydroxy-6-metoxy-1,4-benzoquinol methylase